MVAIDMLAAMRTIEFFLGLCIGATGGVYATHLLHKWEVAMKDVPEVDCDAEMQKRLEK